MQKYVCNTSVYCGVLCEYRLMAVVVGLHRDVISRQLAQLRCAT